VSRILVVWGDKDFQVEVPDDAKCTFGPFSPPSSTAKSYGGDRNRGTLRIYKGSKTTENVIAVFSGVEGFRDASLDYIEMPLTAKHPHAAAAPAEIVSWSEMTDEERDDLARRMAISYAEGLTETTTKPIFFKEDEDVHS
jgi:hypothetical protein